MATVIASAPIVPTVDSIVVGIEKLEVVKAEVAPAKQLRKITMAEVALHNKPTDLWMVIDGDVYDVTAFRTEHPGGEKILYGVAGKEATKKFKKYHNLFILTRYKKDLIIGVIDLDADLVVKEEPKGLMSMFRKKK